MEQEINFRKVMENIDNSLESVRAAIEQLDENFGCKQLGEGEKIRVSDSYTNAVLAEKYLRKTKAILDGSGIDEPTLDERFQKCKHVIFELRESMSDEYADSEDPQRLGDVGDAITLLSDAAAIIERAQLINSGCLRDRTFLRVILQAVGDYFTVDHTTPELRYRGIPGEYQK